MGSHTILWLFLISTQLQCTPSKATVSSQPFCCHEMLDKWFPYMGNTLKGTFIFWQTSPKFRSHALWWSVIIRTANLLSVVVAVCDLLQRWTWAVDPDHSKRSGHILRSCLVPGIHVNEYVFIHKVNLLGTSVLCVQRGHLQEDDNYS